MEEIFGKRYISSPPNGGSFTVQNFACADKPRLALTAFRTDKPVGPPYFLEVLRTCLLSGKGFLKLKQTPFSVNLSHSCTVKKGS